MNEKIERAPAAAKLGKYGVDRLYVLAVARLDEVGADRRRERLHAFAESIALIGEGELCAVGGKRLGDAPRNGVIVGDPHDQAALAVHQSRHGSGVHML